MAVGMRKTVLAREQNDPLGAPLPHIIFGRQRAVVRAQFVLPVQTCRLTACRWHIVEMPAAPSWHREDRSLGLRETLNQHPGIATGTAIGVIVLVLGYIVFGTAGRGANGGPAPVANRAFYSDDDGAHWFADDVTKVPPFDHNGKQAVRAKVYRCDGKTFVNHMERYTPEAHKRLEQAYARAA